MALAISNAREQGFGRPVSSFSLPLLNGSGRRSLNDYLACKKGAVIVFWSAVCAHCRRYDSYLNSFIGKHPQLGFVAIASRYGEKLLQIQEATKGRRLFFPIVLDESGETARQWFAQQTPRCYMVTADARLAYRGAIDNFKSPTDKDYVAYLEPAIASFLAGESIVRPETASFGCSVETTYYHLPRQL
jgi:hypothetical protein